MDKSSYWFKNAQQMGVLRKKKNLQLGYSEKTLKHGIKDDPPEELSPFLCNSWKKNLIFLAND